MTLDRPWTCPPTLGCSATDGVSAERISWLANTSPETRSLSRWPPKLFGIAGHATHELRTSTKNLLRVSYEGRQRKRGVCEAFGAKQRNRDRDYFGALRRTSTRPRATSLARAISDGSKEIAATRWWPPPPYFSASDARFWSAVARFQGLVPRETFARTADALTLIE